MTHAFASAAALLWSIIATLAGAIVLLAVIGFLAHEVYALVSRFFTNTNETQE